MDKVSSPHSVDKIPEVDKSSDSVFDVDSLGKVTTLALTAIPVEMKQGEEQPSSAASPIYTLPTVSCHYTMYMPLKASFVNHNIFICIPSIIFLWMADFIGPSKAVSLLHKPCMY